MTDTKTIVKFINNNRSISTSLTEEVRDLLHKYGLHSWQALQGPLEIDEDVFNELDALVSPNIG